MSQILHQQITDDVSKILESFADEEEWTPSVTKRIAQAIDRYAKKQKKFLRYTLRVSDEELTLFIQHKNSPTEIITRITLDH